MSLHSKDTAYTARHLDWHTCFFKSLAASRLDVCKAKLVRVCNLDS